MAFVAVATMALVPCAQAQKRATPATNDDDTFLALREAARRDEATKAAELAARLNEYSLLSYVEYYRIRPRMRLQPVQEIRDFLARYEGTAIADRLRNDWLLELGRQ